MLYLNSVPPRLLCKTKKENDVSTSYEIEQDLVFTLQPTKEIETIMWIFFCDHNFWVRIWLRHRRQEPIISNERS